MFILNKKLTFGQPNKYIHSIKVSNLIIRGELNFSPAGLITFLLLVSGLGQNSLVYKSKLLPWTVLRLDIFFNALLSSRRSTFYQQFDIMI